MQRSLSRPSAGRLRFGVGHTPFGIHPFVSLSSLFTSFFSYMAASGLPFHSDVLATQEQDLEYSAENLGSNHLYQTTTIDLNTTAGSRKYPRPHNTAHPIERPISGWSDPHAMNDPFVHQRDTRSIRGRPCHLGLNRFFLFSPLLIFFVPPPFRPT
jgi:hypothetical protein